MPDMEGHSTLAPYEDSEALTRLCEGYAAVLLLRTGLLQIIHLLLCRDHRTRWDLALHLS